MKLFKQMLTSFAFDKRKNAVAPHTWIRISGGMCIVMNAETQVRFTAPEELSGCDGVFEAAKILKCLPMFESVSGDGQEISFSVPGTLKLTAVAPIADYPELTKSEKKEKMLVTNLDAFNAAADFCWPCASVDDSRGCLRGIYFDAERKAMVATDGRVLAKYTVEQLEGQSCIVPVSFFNLIKKLSAVLPDYGILISSVSEKIEAEFGPVRIIQDVVEGTFPNWTQVLPKDLSGTCHMAVDKVMPWLKNLGQMKVGDECSPVLIELSDTDTMLSAASRLFVSHWGEYRLRLYGFASEKTRIQLAYEYFKAAIEQVGNGVCMAFNPETPFAAVKFQAAAMPENFVLVMPMKLV
jgi:DNA polymerase III sliding clamp (beta) subunit (PCNA family)